MKKVLSIILVAIMLTGCSSVSQEEYNSLVKENEQITGKYENLQNNYDIFNKNYDKLKSSYDELQKNFDEYKSKNIELQANYNTYKTNYDVLKTKYDKLQSDYEKLKADFETTSKATSESENITISDDVLNLQKDMQATVGTTEQLCKSAISSKYKKIYTEHSLDVWYDTDYGFIMYIDDYHNRDDEKILQYAAVDILDIFIEYAGKKMIFSFNWVKKDGTLVGNASGSLIGSSVMQLLPMYWYGEYNRLNSNPNYEYYNNLAFMKTE